MAMNAHPNCPAESHEPEDDCWCLLLFTLDELIVEAARAENQPGQGDRR